MLDNIQQRTDAQCICSPCNPKPKHERRKTATLDDHGCCIVVQLMMLFATRNRAKSAERGQDMFSRIWNWFKTHKKIVIPGIIAIVVLIIGFNWKGELKPINTDYENRLKEIKDITDEIEAANTFQRKVRKRGKAFKTFLKTRPFISIKNAKITELASGSNRTDIFVETTVKINEKNNIRVGLLIYGFVGTESKTFQQNLKEMGALRVLNTEKTYTQKRFLGFLWRNKVTVSTVETMGDGPNNAIWYRISKSCVTPSRSPCTQ